MEMNDAKLIEFTHIPPEAGVWRQVLDLGTRLRFRKGEEIMHGGERGEYLYYVHQGEARLMRTTLDGREKILMSMRSGTVTGETPFFDEVPARSSIVAGTDCVVYAFSRDCVLHEILPNYPALTLALLHSLASKVRVLCNQSVSLSLEELPPRHLPIPAPTYAGRRGRSESPRVAGAEPARAGEPARRASGDAQ